jgi:hypothetical protein
MILNIQVTRFLGNYFVSAIFELNVSHTAVVELTGITFLVTICVRLEKHHNKIGHVKLARSKLGCKIEVKLVS